MDGIARVQLLTFSPVTRSTIDPPNSLTVSNPPVTAVEACWATSFATRVTRAIGDRDAAFCPVLALRLAPPRLAALFLIAGRFAERFLIVGRLAEDFFGAAPRFAGRAFFPERFADAARPLRRFDALRLLALLLPDFLRDFLARAAMTLLLGVGDDGQRV
jgi:hypothetical protein